MSQKKGHDDGAFGRVLLRGVDLARRVAEGTIPEGRALLGIQMLSEGATPEAIKIDPRLPSVDGLKRLVLEPDRPLNSWREILKIETRDWSDDIEVLFGEPEPWERELSEVWYGLEKPGRNTYSIEAANLLFSLGLHGFSQRMGFALAKAEPELVREAPMPLIGSARQDSSGNLREPFLGVRGGRLCALVSWDDSGYWDGRCVFAGFRKFQP